MELQQPLSNVQEEILKLYSLNLSPEELTELKTLLGKFYALKASREADQVWEREQLSDDIMDQWLNAE
ncbi:MAG: hypothetical protein L6Q47_11480 [Ignavibacteriaceae bacterium]|nr:hypothetical protein [Ignavibacteriaceae bacterium]